LDEKIKLKKREGEERLFYSFEGEEKTLNEWKWDEFFIRSESG